jgi:hypothetical protein
MGGRQRIRGEAHLPSVRILAHGGCEQTVRLLDKCSVRDILNHK